LRLASGYIDLVPLEASARISPWTYQSHGSADQRLQSLLVHLVAFMEVDGAAQIPLETGIEEA